ncbi:tRNA (cytosine(72)-C(5))-methyltransferase NSUN6-like isoform X2 [Halichondria panicea]|uniref:tRNA (cytosine(72)-C(5))-methyltransferase NSUN6-like isoform X2 n=1 Tax=Halichondria panicea TaxID=6063 RepID=UPI00312BA917
MAKSDGDFTARAEQYLESVFDAVKCKDGDQVLLGRLLHSCLRQCLAVPPAATTVRINTLKYHIEDAQPYLSICGKGSASSNLLFHPDIPDMVSILNEGPRTDLVHQKKKIIVGFQCGNSVLRGADVYVPGVSGAPKSLVKGDHVSVYSDVDKKCLKGTAGEFTGTTMFVGNGGKTVHIATLMKDKGILIALDKSTVKIDKIQQNLDKFHISCARCFKFDATKSLSETKDARAEPPFPSESFDRILLDAPCSALGQRPQFTLSQSTRDLQSYPHYQRMMLKQAIGLLTTGGVLVYSTCTYSPEENESQVQWVLQEYNNMHLVEQHPFVGYSGLPGFGLEERDLKKVQRFWPDQFVDTLDKHVAISIPQNRTVLLDTISFFIAKFQKK